MDKEMIPKKLPVYNLEINEDDDTKVNFISLVQNPAIEIDFFAFDKTASKKKFEFKVQDTERMMIAGPLMVPDMPLYRKDPDSGEEYFVQMNRDTINMAQQKFMKSAYNKNINQNHADVVHDAYLIENWVIDNTKCDKSATMGFSLPEGTWFGVVKIDSQEYWDKYIKTGDFSAAGGFSVEGIFSYGKKIGEKNLSKEGEFNKINVSNLDDLVDFLVDFKK